MHHLQDLWQHAPPLQTHAQPRPLRKAAKRLAPETDGSTAALRQSADAGPSDRNGGFTGRHSVIKTMYCGGGMVCFAPICMCCKYLPGQVASTPAAGQLLRTQRNVLRSPFDSWRQRCRRVSRLAGDCHCHSHTNASTAQDHCTWRSQLSSNLLSSWFDAWDGYRALRVKAALKLIHRTSFDCSAPFA